MLCPPFSFNLAALQCCCREEEVALGSQAQQPANISASPKNPKFNRSSPDTTQNRTINPFSPLPTAPTSTIERKTKMFRQLARSRALPVFRGMGRRVAVQRRTLIAPPKPNSGPLMERRADRELPDIPENGMKWVRTVPIFLTLLITSCLCIFNYQKSSSSVVSSTMYALRTCPKAREYLGNEIYFKHKMPWIWGEMNQLHGRIDIRFSVKGDRESGMMRFTSYRKGRMGLFVTTEWSLETGDGRKIDLLDGGDPFKGIEVDEREEKKQVGRGSYAPNLSG